MLPSRPFAILGAILALGLTIFGYQLGLAVKKGREFDRYFTVRGLSEKEVKATLVIWPMKYSTRADSLMDLKQSMERAQGIVLNYLKASGIADTEISFGLPEIRDTISSRKKDDVAILPRYLANITMVVRSRNVDVVKNAIQRSDTLIEKGVPLVHEEYGNTIDFLFDGINEMRPSMIKEATANARQAAEKFAEDSKAKVGSIRKATQGIIEINNRDIASPELKVLRLITTVDFFIE